MAGTGRIERIYRRETSPHLAEKLGRKNLSSSSTCPAPWAPPGPRPGARSSRRSTDARASPAHLVEADLLGGEPPIPGDWLFIIACREYHVHVAALGQEPGDARRAGHVRLDVDPELAQLAAVADQAERPGACLVPEEQRRVARRHVLAPAAGVARLGALDQGRSRPATEPARRSGPSSPGSGPCRVRCLWPGLQAGYLIGAEDFERPPLAEDTHGSTARRDRHLLRGRHGDSAVVGAVAATAAATASGTLAPASKPKRASLSA
jgi:hypothetical protein